MFPCSDLSAVEAHLKAFAFWSMALSKTPRNVLCMSESVLKAIPPCRAVFFSQLAGQLGCFEGLGVGAACGLP